LTGRLKDLGGTAAALRQGDYKARCPVNGQDEIAQLQADFNRMADNLEQTIEALNREKAVVNGLLNERKELVASVSHELKTPITTIMNYLEVTQASIQKQGDKELSANVESIHQEVDRLNLIVNDLFDLSRAEVGRLTIRSEECSIPEIIRQVVAAQKPLAWQNQHVELVSQIEDDLPTVHSDRNRLVQILSNLVRNGIQHTPPGGIVQVRAGKRKNKVVLTVVDTGEGICPDDMPHIWTRFYRGRSSGSGNGIGLSVVKELTELLGGEVSVKSEVGMGSEFQVVLPVHPPKKAKTTSQA
jgi:signal transduction histidine kinase